jgi:glycosyltransferase involved in cell wall biosynthesis
MKVTLIGTLPPIKALSPYCFHLAEALSEKIDVEFINFHSILPDFLYSGGTKTEEDIVYTVKNIQTKNLLKWYNPISWIKAGLEATGDVIHAQHWALYSSAMYCIILPIAKIRGKKRILSIHNITPHENGAIFFAFDTFLNRIVFPFADVLIVHNIRNKEKLISLYGIDEQKISIITHGTLHTYHQIIGISQQNAREHLQIPQHKKIILFFGYLWSYKGLDILLASLSLVKKTLNGVVVLIAGQPLRDWGNYEKIIKERGLENDVIKKLQYIPDQEVEYFFSSADLVVLPYKKEPFDTHGGVGALALSFKKPLLVTDVGGLPEYVKDKRMIVSPDDAEELSSRIILVFNDAVLLNKLSKDSEELAKELSWDKIADKTIAVYQSVLQKVIEV